MTPVRVQAEVWVLLNTIEPGELAVVICTVVSPVQASCPPWVRALASSDWDRTG
jgi:hypothetical protein